MKDVDLVICVFACDTIERYKQEIIKINETWGKVAKSHPNIELLFFLGEAKTDIIGPNYIHLQGVENDNMSALYKQMFGLKYIYENYNSKFIFVCGTDTYPNIKKLLQFIGKYNHSDNLYIGGHGDYRYIGKNKLYFHSGGPGFIITSTCLAKLYPMLENAPIDWIQLCVDLDVVRDLAGASDVAIAGLIQLPTINSTIVKIDDMSFLHCNYKGFPCHINQVDVKNIISCHKMSSIDFDCFTKILEDNNYFV
jgi:hypothetical protein